MGRTLGLETITREEIPFWFTNTDSKHLGYLLEELGFDDDGELSRLFKYLQLEMNSLEKIAYGQDEPFGTFLPRSPIEDRKHLWQEQRAERALAWQNPKDIVSDLELLLKAMDNNPDLFSQANISSEYFLLGYFQQEMTDLLRMATWAYERGIEKVRLSITY